MKISELALRAALRAKSNVVIGNVGAGMGCAVDIQYDMAQEKLRPAKTDIDNSIRLEKMAGQCSFKL